MTEYCVYGPFRIPRNDHGVIDHDVSAFWKEVDAEEPGLSTATGVYVFLVKASGGGRYTPWYVGRTRGNAQGFRGECFAPHKRNCYSEAMARYERGRPHLILLARLTPGGGLAHNQNASDIDFLENYCMGLAIRANPELINRQNTMHYTEVVVPGLLNNRGNLNGAARALKEAFEL